jgi:hypothetical protein
MQRRSPEYSRRNRRRSARAAGLARTAMVLSVLGFGAAGSISPSVAQTAAAEIGYVAAMRGRVVVLAATPVVLDPLDVIRDRDQLDLPAGSELRFCHYPTERLVTLKGPLRASVSTHGITAENGRPLELPATSCVAPRVSKHQGGLVARGPILVTR